jgi:hypothetical protein
MMNPIINMLLKSFGPSDDLKNKLRPIFGYALFSVVFIILIANAITNFQQYGKIIGGKSLYIKEE